MFLQEKSWVMDIIRELLANIDALIYNLIKWILYIIFDLTSLSTSSEVLNGVYSRIYVILGVFMAFKLSFSFFKYIITPDAMTDKKQGVARLFGNVLIMLSALILIPSLLFGTGGGTPLITRAQQAFLPMLPRILLGVNTGSSINSSDNTLDQAANDMAVAALGAFFMPSERIDEACGSGTKDKKPVLKEIDDITKYAKDTCSNGLSVDLGVVGTVGAKIYYTYSYTYLVAGIVGIILIITLLGMTIDVAKRVFKLIILEVIAPIPIMSLIDPDAATKGAFGNWLKTLIYTFLDIFIKIGIIYVIIYLIQLIVNKGLFTNFPEFSENPIRVSLLIVALILGLIFFAREAPKFIKDSLGIKDKGEGGGFAGKALALAGGAAAGFAGGVMHGSAGTGMVEGFNAARNAKPGQSAHAFRAGSDKAAQLRTGDDKYKTGFAASLQRHMGRRAGYSNQGLKSVKDAVKARTAEVQDFQDAWQEFVNNPNRKHSEINGVALDTSSDENYRNSLRSAISNAQEKQVKAEKHQKQYEAGMHSYGMSTTREPGGIAGGAYRATRAVTGAIAAPIRAAGTSVAHAAEAGPGPIGSISRTIASAHHQHELNEIDRGKRANNVVDKDGHTTIDVARDRRNELDSDGTLQATIKNGMDVLTDKEHDGHFGKYEPTIDDD